MIRNICVVTGTRAEFGLLRFLMQEIKDQPEFCLQTVVTGMHLSPEYGNTYREVENAGFSIDAKVEMLLSSDSSAAITKSMGLGLIGFADAFLRLQPDLVILLGDRFEIFSAAAASMIAGIPIAHIHGGETTEGAFDESIRHAITKMSHLHFVAAEDYKRRVIQLGERPENVFVVGGMGVDAINKVNLLSKKDFEKSIEFPLNKKNLLVTFHPVTLDGENGVDQMKELLLALRDLENTNIIFTMPNADNGSREITAMVSEFVACNHNSKAFLSLGQLRYFSAMKLVDVVVGNSSSGLLEAPALKTPSINIGDRQKGRLMAASVINCEPTAIDIKLALERAFDEDFIKSIEDIESPYGHGGAAGKIVSTLKVSDFQGLLKKSFFDIKNC